MTTWVIEDDSSTATWTVSGRSETEAFQINAFQSNAFHDGETDASWTQSSSSYVADWTVEN